MNEEQEQKIKEALANGFLNAFNLTIIIEACKFHAIKLASDKFSDMSEEEKNEALTKISEAQEKKAV